MLSAMTGWFKFRFSFIALVLLINACGGGDSDRLPDYKSWSRFMVSYEPDNPERKYSAGYAKGGYSLHESGQPKYLFWIRQPDGAISYYHASLASESHKAIELYDVDGRTPKAVFWFHLLYKSSGRLIGEKEQPNEIVRAFRMLLLGSEDMIYDIDKIVLRVYHRINGAWHLIGKSTIFRNKVPKNSEVLFFPPNSEAVKDLRDESLRPAVFFAD